MTHRPLGRGSTIAAAAVLWGLAGCGPQGLAPQTPLRPLPRLAPGTRAPGARPMGYYRFTEPQWQRMALSACRFHPASRRAARLYRRGFSADEIVQACVDLRRYGQGDDRYLERIAAYRRAGLSLSGFSRYQRSGKSLTDYYNEDRIGGSGLTIAGLVLTLTAGFFIAGAVGAQIDYEVRMARCRARIDPTQEEYCDETGLDGMLTRLFGLIFGVAGGVIAVPGAFLGGIGLSRQRRWLRGNLLDVGHVDDLDRFTRRYLHPPPAPAVAVSLAPLVTRGGGGGLRLVLRW